MLLCGKYRPLKRCRLLKGEGKMQYYVADAFADKVFEGNPAGAGAQIQDGLGAGRRSGL